MGTETCRKLRWFWAWQDEREEAWLGEMSEQGWHLFGIDFPGVYDFRKGQPKHYVYRLDFQTSRLKDREVYLQLFRDAGWEHLGSMSTWEYFRKEAEPGQAAEIFTDPESKIEKYQRVLRALVIFFPILFILFSTSWTHLEERGVMGTVLSCIMLGILLLYAFGTMGILRRIGELRKTIKR
jgi:hypothetical protein